MTYIDENNCIRVQEMTAQERAFAVAFDIADGASLTTRQVAEMTGLSYTGAWYLMQYGCRVTPIYQDEDGRWRRLK